MIITLVLLIAAQVIFNLVMFPLRRSLPRLMRMWRLGATASLLKLLLYCVVPVCFFFPMVLLLISLFCSGSADIFSTRIIDFFPELIKLNAIIAGIFFIPYLIPKLKKFFLKNPQIIDSIQLLFIARLMVELVFVNLKPQSLVPPGASFYEYICFIANFEKLLVPEYVVLIWVFFSFMLDYSIGRKLKKVFRRKKTRRLRFLAVVITQMLPVILFLKVSLGGLEKADYKYGDFFNETPSTEAIYKIFLFRNIAFYIDGMADFGYYVIDSVSARPVNIPGSVRRFNSTDFTPLD